jgi:hypothetical protein
MKETFPAFTPENQSVNQQPEVKTEAVPAEESTIDKGFRYEHKSGTVGYYKTKEELTRAIEDERENSN